MAVSLFKDILTCFVRLRGLCAPAGHNSGWTPAIPNKQSCVEEPINLTSRARAALEVHVACQAEVENRQHATHLTLLSMIFQLPSEVGREIGPRAAEKQVKSR